MNYVLAVFKSRSATLNFANILRSNGIPVAIINTPQSISKSCGISLKFFVEYFEKVKEIASRMQIFAYFDGFYTYVFQNGRQFLTKI